MKNIYFLSDAHLGSRAIEHGRTQERRLVNFLDSIKHKASAIYLLGDMFDFWYEFRLVVPKLSLIHIYPGVFTITNRPSSSQASIKAGSCGQCALRITSSPKSFSFLASRQ